MRRSVPSMLIVRRSIGPLPDGRRTDARDARGGRGLACHGRYATSRFALACLYALLMVPHGCRKSEPTEQAASLGASGVWFEEIAEPSGLVFRHVSGATGAYYAPEAVGGGVALFDYDNDGDLDVYFVQGGSLDPAVAKPPGNQLFRNRGDGTFEDVTAAAGVGDRGYGMGCACADFDGDGFVDLYVTNVGPNVLYRNNGDGTFSDVTIRSGVGDRSWSASAAFVDYDADGRLDLLVANYVFWTREREIGCLAPTGARDYCGPNSYQAPQRDTLYRNVGGGRFKDVTEEVGLGRAFGNGLGVVVGDFDLDDRVDFYIANDATDNQLWLGRPGGRFADEALIAGCAVNAHGMPEAGMGVSAVDVDNDGDLDLFLSHLRDETNTFYLNEGGTFEDASMAVGLGTPSVPYTGFGLGFADFDHDGRLDVYIANGAIQVAVRPVDPTDGYAEPNLLFRGMGHSRFEEVLPRGGTAGELIATSRGAAFGDLDGDGGIDIVVVNKDANAYLLRNVVATRGHWLKLRVLERNGRVAFGAMVRVTAEGKVQWRPVQSAYSYCAANDPTVHVGLGRASDVAEVMVRWPDGQTESFGAFAANAIHELRRGKGR